MWMRRKRSEWMTRTDDEILEYLLEERAGTPKRIADVIEKHNNYVNARLSILAEYGLVDKPSRGFYTITDLGEAYLAGELDASELED